MADWILIPCLKALFAEFDRIAPDRDHASDGSVGDQRHQDEVSDHNPDETGSVPIHDADHVNEIHAIDVDNQLRQDDVTMEKVVQFLLGRCRSGAEKRLRYIIYNRRIWSASSGWVQKTYTGASPHTEHAHFSASYVASLEASTASWGLVEEFGQEEDDMRFPKKGDEGETVKYWQLRLQATGFDPGAIDGVYGDKMEAAVNASRKAYGEGPHVEITGWHAYKIDQAFAAKYAGKDGEPGKPAVLTGQLKVTGGQLTVEAGA